MINSNQVNDYEKSEDERSELNKDEKNEPDKLEKFTNLLFLNTPKHVFNNASKLWNEEHKEDQIPSYYMMTKKYRIFDGFKFQEKQKSDCLHTSIQEDDNIIFQTENQDIISGEIKKNIENLHSLNTSECYSGYLRGGLKESIKILLKKHKDFIGNGDKHIGLMNSFDGANHLVTNQGSVPII